jgi:lipoprotein-anchoring transpeptidase ErfK/SrfK
MSHHSHPHRAVDPHPIAGFIDRYRWRAYALPVLTLLTLIALFRSGGGHNQADAAGHRAAAMATASTPAATPGPTRTIALPGDPGLAGAQYADQSATAGSSTPCSSNTSARRVIVSIGSQHAWMCAKSTVVFSTAVTTGAVDKGDATPTGTFHIQGNQKGATLTGANYAVHVQYWIQFNGDIGFHDAPWQTMKFGTAQYRTKGSLGCVHMPLPSIAWLHKWVQIGQTVVTVTKA